MEKQVEFKVGNLTLRGTLYTPKGSGPFPGIVIFHGRGSSRKSYDQLSQRLAEMGFLVHNFDFRGCGKSDGVLEEGTQRMGIDDARAGLEILLKQNLDRNRIGIVGSSFGGFVGAVLAGEYDIKSMALRAPAVYPNETLDTYVDSIEGLKFPKEKWLESIAYKEIQKFKGKLLLVESEKDEVVASWVVKAYFENAITATKKELSIQKGAPHSLSATPKFKKEFEDKVIEWFSETL